MFRKILVPLDGSELAEKVLPFVQGLASNFASEIHLVFVSEASEEWGRVIDSYLKGLASRLGASETKVRWAVLFGRPAEELLDYCVTHRVDLIAMASHGRSGISRWAVGSVTDKIVRGAAVPVLVCPAGSSPEKAGAARLLRRLLLPLDGSKLAEGAIPVVTQLAQKLGAEVVLLSVVEQVNQEDKAQKYLARICKRFQRKKIKATIEVKAGVPAQQILESAGANDVDLVALSTHGRGGVSRWLLGSVADKLVRTAPCAVLLTRAGGETPSETYVSPAQARQCYNCGRRTHLRIFFPEDRCLRCGFHLRACGNCVQYSGVGCLLQRPEVHDTYPGMHCPVFVFRQTPVAVK